MDFLILTTGIIYELYSYKMDNKPFAVLDFRELQDDQISKFEMLAESECLSENISTMESAPKDAKEKYV